MTLTICGITDAVEIYLPGVITQAASKELKASATQEGLLGIILYVCLALSHFVLPLIKNKIGREGGILFSLYTSIVASVVCAVVPNYWTLLISRALLGICIGLNMAVTGVCFAEQVSSYDMFNVGKLFGLISFTE